MIRIMGLAVLTAAGLLLSGCGAESGKKSKKYDKIGDLEVVEFEDLDVVASRNDNGLVVADVSKIGETKAMLLSELAEDVRIVRLDNAEEALVRSGNVWMTENRFVIYDGNEIKQFDKDGKYIGKIGSKGNGPGEYFIAPYDIAVDESNGKIYVLAYNAQKILSYDLEGKFTGDIPLAHEAKKGFMRMNQDGTMTIGALTFADGDEHYAVWRQDMQGNMIDGVKAGALTVTPDFSNEIFGGAGEKGFSYSLFRLEADQDSIYEYAANELKPVFTADFGEKIPMHNFISFPGFYIVDVIGKPVEVAPGSYQLPSLIPMLIDKKTLKGCPVELVLDFIGPIKADRNWIFSKNAEYFVNNLDPGDLSDAIQKALDEQSDMDEQDRTKLKEFQESISDDDNNYLIVGKWKK